MLDVLLALLQSVLSGFQSHSWLVLEKLVLRHQLTVLKRQTRKPKLWPADPLLWVGLLRFWPRWQHALSNEHKESRHHVGMSIGCQIPQYAMRRSKWLVELPIYSLYPLLAARLMAGRTEAEKRKPPQPVTFGLFIKVY